LTQVDLGLVLDNTVVFAVGYAVLYAVAIVDLRLGSALFAGLAYLVGWALIGVLLTLAMLAGVDPGIPAFLIIAGLSLGVCVCCRVRTSPPTTTPVRTAPQSRGTSVFAAVPAVLGAGMIAVASLAAFSVAVKGQLYAGYIDAFQFWIPKAETIYYAHGIDPTMWGAIRHAEYPPLSPVMNAVTFHFVGGFHPSVLPFQSTLLGVAFLLAVVVLVDRFAPRWISLPTVALLGITPWFWARLQTPLTDQMVAYLIAAAAIAGVIWLYERNRAFLVLAFILLAAATLTKLEGGFMAELLALVVAAAAIVLYGRTAPPALVLLAAPAVALPWRLWLHHHGLPGSSPDYHAADLLKPSFLSERSGRLTGTVRALYEGLLTPQLQTSVIIWVSVAALIILAWRMPVIAGAVAAWFGLSLVGLTIVYWIGRLALSWYLETSLSRVGTTVIIVGGALTPLFLGLALRATTAPTRRATRRSRQR
jgi:hypothetical protein